MKIILFALLLVWCGSVGAETAYVIDNVNAKLRSGKGENYRTLRVLSSKTEVEILEPDEEFAKVKTIEGQIGWIKSSLLKTLPPTGKNIIENVDVTNQRTETRSDTGESVKLETLPPKQTIEAAGVTRGSELGEKSLVPLLLVALVSFLAGIMVGALALRTYYLRRLHGLRI